MPLTDVQVRHWLANFHIPEALADDAMRTLLRAHGRPCTASVIQVANEASALILDRITSLVPPRGAPSYTWRPYAVLVSYARGDTVARAAIRLGMSERQVSRERARAVALLRGELQAHSS